MEPRTLARWQAAVRMTLGAAHVVQPARAPVAWVGADARHSGVQVYAIAFGARDAALGAGVLATAGTVAVKPWLLAGAASDVADLLATLRAREELSPLIVAGVAAVASASTLLGLWLASEL